MAPQGSVGTLCLLIILLLATPSFGGGAISGSLTRTCTSAVELEGLEWICTVGALELQSTNSTLFRELCKQLSSSLSPSPTPPSPLCCRVKDGVVADEVSDALAWTCSSANIYYPLDCDAITTGLSADASILARANEVFDAYWRASGMADHGCCFGNSDGKTGCQAAVTSQCDGPPPQTPPPPSPPGAGALDPSVDLVVSEGETFTIRSSAGVQHPRAIVVFGSLIVESHVYLMTDYLEIEEGGELIIGPDAVNVRIHLLHEDCTGLGRECLRAGQLLSRGSVRIIGREVTPWTLLTNEIEAAAKSIAVEDCDGWEIGGTVVVAPDAYTQDAQTREITAISAGCEIHVDIPLDRRVFFREFKTGPAIALEVLYLTRNVLITGPMYPSRQGIVTSQRNTGVFVMENVRVENCGRLEVGEYCTHLHVLESCVECRIAGNAIVNGVSKGITVHRTHDSIVDNNVVFNIRGVGLYVEDGREMNNTFTYNAIGCPTMSGCRCINCAPSQSFGDDTRQAGIYAKSASNHLIGNRVFGALVALLYEQSGATAKSIYFPFGETRENVFHSCQSFGWYPTNTYPRNVVRDETGHISAVVSARPYDFNGHYNGAEARIVQHTEYAIHDFGAGAYESADVIFVSSRIAGRTALYFKTYFRGPETGPFFTSGELIANPGVGLNLAGGSALIEFDDVTFHGKLTLPHHAFTNGGLLAAHYYFRGGDVFITEIDTEGDGEPLAIIVSKSGVNIILDKSRAVLDLTSCFNEFRDAKILTCPESTTGALRAVQVFSSGPGPLFVQVVESNGATFRATYALETKKSSGIGLFMSDSGEHVTYSGYSFIVPAGSIVTVETPDEIAAFEYSHLGWSEETAQETTITLNLISASANLSNCVVRSDHVREQMTPYGPSVAVDVSSVCT